MLVYPDMVLLDLVGPQTVLSIAGAEIHLVARDTVPVTTDVGVAVAPTTLFAECPAALGFLHDRGAGALRHERLHRLAAAGRVVEDGNRITGAGVTAGLNFALLLAARLAGEQQGEAHPARTRVRSRVASPC